MVVPLYLPGLETRTVNSFAIEFKKVIRLIEMKSQSGKLTLLDCRTKDYYSSLKIYMKYLKK